MNQNNIPVWHMECVWKTDRFQEWWVKRWNDPEGPSMSNIRVGDFFTLGKYNQVGLIVGKTNILYTADNKPNDAPCHFQYQISGDIGGHWYMPSHEDMEGLHGGESYFRFIPSATQLAELSTVLEDYDLFQWAERLIVHYNDYPTENTHRAHLLRLEREAKESK